MIIIPTVFLISFSIELTVIYLLTRRNNILNYSRFIIYILFVNLVTFPITHVIVYFPGGGYYFWYSLSSCILVQMIPISIEFILLRYFFKKLYYKDIIEYEIEYLGYIVLLANISSFSLGVIMNLFIPL